MGGNVKDDIKILRQNIDDIKNSGKSQAVETNISIVKEKPNRPTCGNLSTFPRFFGGTTNSSTKTNLTNSGDQIEEKNNNEDGKKSSVVINTKEETTIVKDDKSFPSLPVKK